MKILKIDKPCSENWEKMIPSDNGRFCELCSKNVIDFTQMNNNEILELISKSSENQICGRLFSHQLNRNLNTLKSDESVITVNHKSSKIKIPKIAAGVLLATALSGATYAQGDVRIETTKTVITEKVGENSNKQKNKNDTSADKIILIKGILRDNQTNNPIENAEVIFFTLSKRINGFTNKNGEFSIEVPDELIKDKNIICLKFDKIIPPEKQNLSQEEKDTLGENQWEYFQPFAFDDETMIVSEDEIKNSIVHKAYRTVMMLGGIRSRDYNPLVIYNGNEMSLKDYYENYSGKSCTSVSTKKEYFEFNIEEAQIIIGEKGKNGLIVINEIITAQYN